METIDNDKTVLSHTDWNIWRVIRSTQLRRLLQLNLINTLFTAFQLKAGRLALLVYRHVHCHVARSARLEGEGRLEIGKIWEGGGFMPSEFNLMAGARLRVEGNFSIYTGCSISVNRRAKLVLGSGYMNKKVTVDCFQEIVIGHGVAISKGVTIRDSDNHAITGSRQTTAPVRIGDRVWIGLNATILKGVSIGDGAVIAAGAVVTKSVPPKVLAAGVPARVIRENVEWH